MTHHIWLIYLLITSYTLFSCSSTQIEPIVLPVERLTNHTADERTPVWSPDGTQFAFVGHHEGNPEIYVQAVGSDEAINLSRSPLDDYAPQWSPDGRYILYYHRIRKTTLLPELIRIADIESGEVITLNEEPDTYHFYHWTPDATTLYFSSQHVVWRYHIPTQTLTALHEIDITSSIYQDVAKVIVRESNMVWLVRERTETWSNEVFHINLERDDEPHRLTEDNFEPQLILSADGRYLVSQTYSEQSRVVQIIDFQTGDTRIFPMDWVRLWGWSAENHLLGQHSADGVWELFTITPEDDTPQTLLTINHAVRDGAWSPTNPNHVAFTTYAGLYIVDVSNGNFSNILHGQGQLGKLIWSPDGQKIAIPAYTDPPSDWPKFGSLWAVGVSGDAAGRYIVAEVTHSKDTADPQWAPDSQSILFNIQGDNELDIVQLPFTDSAN